VLDRDEISHEEDPWWHTRAIQGKAEKSPQLAHPVSNYLTSMLGKNDELSELRLKIGVPTPVKRRIYRGELGKSLPSSSWSSSSSSSSSSAPKDKNGMTPETQPEEQVQLSEAEQVKKGRKKVDFDEFTKRADSLLSNFDSQTAVVD
jgi:hypothetical protein